MQNFNSFPLLTLTLLTGVFVNSAKAQPHLLPPAKFGMLTQKTTGNVIFIERYDLGAGAWQDHRGVVWFGLEKVGSFRDVIHSRSLRDAAGRCENLFLRLPSDLDALQVVNAMTDATRHYQPQILAAFKEKAKFWIESPFGADECWAFSTQTGKVEKESCSELLPSLCVGEVSGAGPSHLKPTAVPAQLRYDAPLFSASMREPSTPNVSSFSNWSLLGQPNLGLTCYANSVHALLWSDPRVLTATSPQSGLIEFQLPETRGKNQIAVRTQLQAAFHGLLRKFTNAQEKIRAADSGVQLPRESLVMELTLLFDSLENALEDIQGSKLLDISNAQSRVRKDFNDAGEYFSRLTDYLDMVRLIGGFKLVSQVHFSEGPPNTPNLGGETLVLDLSMTDPLHFNRADSQIRTLNDAVQKFFVSETVEVRREHPATLANVEGKKQVHLEAGSHGIPSRFYLRLNRFYFDFERETPSKFNLPVDVQTPIKLSVYEEGKEDAVETTWQVRGALVHRGNSATAGHFYAYLFNKDVQQWMIHDDSHVRPLLASEFPEAFRFMDQNGYLFMIERADQ